ncbi:MFS transporter [Anoxybacterium hadale]|uniref:MFS transporter n=1 Tax=Anoxybacterium hadale TaxID=3408580 RepID=A0ACD1ADD1_9FIRM|nr:MFS transporter [Clostridiales bacterium]
MEQENTRNKWSVLMVVVVSTFMSTLDGSIVNVALPNMARALGVGTSRIQLVALSYLIVISGMVLIFGRLGDMIGKSRTFRYGLLIFSVGSLLCGISYSFLFLIVSRVVQAVGAAAMMANNQGIIAEVFPAAERGRALGLSGTAVALGSLVGPGLGGIIVGVGRWEYIFLINVPIGIAAYFFAYRLLPKGKSMAGQKMDGLGALLLLLSIIPLFTALGEGLNRGFTDSVILCGFGVSIVSFFLFIQLEKRKEHPLIRLEIFQNRLFSLSIFCSFLTFVAMFCSNIILPFYLQDVMAYSPQHAGLILMIYPLILMVAAPFGGHLSDKIGSEILTVVGLSLASAGLFAMGTLNQNSSMFHLVLFIAVMAMGMGLFQSPNTSLIMSTVPRNKLGIAGSVNALVRNLGMVSGIALATTVLYSMMSLKLAYKVSNYTAGQDQAFIYGMHVVYLIAAGISLLGAILTLLRYLRSPCWKSERGRVLGN